MPHAHKACKKKKMKKKKKRCIPKEGMPHAQKACFKKKNWTHEGPSIQKKKEEKR